MVLITDIVRARDTLVSRVDVAIARIFIKVRLYSGGWVYWLEEASTTGRPCRHGTGARMVSGFGHAPLDTALRLGRA